MGTIPEHRWGQYPNPRPHRRIHLLPNRLPPRRLPQRRPPQSRKTHRPETRRCKPHPYPYPNATKKNKGQKLTEIQNEFVAYDALQNGAEYQDISNRSRLIATYALAGFANIGSLGNQIGVLAQLAPSRSGDVSRVAVSAMLTGAISTFTSAAIAGLLIQNEAAFISTGSGG